MKLKVSVTRFCINILSTLLAAYFSVKYFMAHNNDAGIGWLVAFIACAYIALDKIDYADDTDS